ncbi:MAG: PIG-L family deacetylase [Nanoarchaeota archaeon]|nr:PIG-L family deacetylase [DPANN group archaeon]MBL7116248.1 PIG-L family deacetylase [Nanoarchaeota archaeon]
MAENILIVAAHSDDQIIGVGGTAAKYVKEGFDVTTVIVSKGEISHPHFKEEIIIDTRKRESIRANKVIGGKAVKFLGLFEKDFNKEVKIYKAQKKLETLIRRLKPVKIFVHAPEDPHPAHKKTNRMVLDIIENERRKIEVYSFDIWNPFRWDRKKHPKLVVDTSETFDTKIKALKCFKSQFNILGFLNFFALATMYVKNVMNGRKYNTKYAEVFYRLR